VKASAYFKHKGFENVYQLEGGSLNTHDKLKVYRVKGKIVFDHRLGKELLTILCRNAINAKPCDVHTNCLNEGCHLLFYPM
jgi:UPF0176 protein